MFRLNGTPPLPRRRGASKISDNSNMRPNHRLLTAWLRIRIRNDPDRDKSIQTEPLRIPIRQS